MKPRVYMFLGSWACNVNGQAPVGRGDTAPAAYADWKRRLSIDWRAEMHEQIRTNPSARVW